jgi:hypothetical protein
MHQQGMKAFIDSPTVRMNTKKNSVTSLKQLSIQDRLCIERKGLRLI